MKIGNKKEQDLIETKKNLLYRIIEVRNLQEYKTKVKEVGNTLQVADDLLTALIDTIPSNIKLNRKALQILLFIITKIATQTIEYCYYGGLI